MAARAVRREQGSPLGDKVRSCRRTTAVRAVRRQRSLAGADDRGLEPERRDEAAGPWETLDDEADKGIAHPSGRPTRTRGQSRAKADHPPWCGGRGNCDLHQHPSDDPRPWMRTCRMNRDTRPSEPNSMSRIVRQDRHASPRRHDSGMTRDSGIQSRQNSPPVRTDKRRRRSTRYPDPRCPPGSPDRSRSNSVADSVRDLWSTSPLGAPRRKLLQCATESLSGGARA